MSRLNIYKRLIGVVNIIKNTNAEVGIIDQKIVNIDNDNSTIKDEILKMENDISTIKHEILKIENDISIIKHEVLKIIKVEGIDSSINCSTDSLSFKNACFALELHDLHTKSFSEFKNIHFGKDVVVVGTGPTMKYYKSIPGIPHIGVNKSFLNPNIQLDYYFTTDYEFKNEYFSKLRDYDFVKFFGQYPSGKFRDTFQFPENMIIENNGRRFYQSEPNEDINLNLEYHPLMGFYSIVFQAIHFALYVGAKRIFLVGCDCTSEGYYDGTTQQGEYTSDGIACWKKGYKLLDEYVKQLYPSVEIISINPVGLKGQFHDVYTADYLKEIGEDFQNKDILDNYFTH